MSFPTRVSSAATASSTGGHEIDRAAFASTWETVAVKALEHGHGHAYPDMPWEPKARSRPWRTATRISRSGRATPVSAIPVGTPIALLQWALFQWALSQCALSQCALSQYAASQCAASQ